MAASEGVLAVQALLEYAFVIRRRRPESLPSARGKIESWSSTYQLAPTTPEVAQAALGLSQAHNLQIWDAVIWSAARRAGATVFLSEDLHDGLSLNGMTVINPFALDADAFARLIAD